MSSPPLCVTCTDIDATPPPDSQAIGPSRQSVSISAKQSCPTPCTHPKFIDLRTKLARARTSNSEIENKLPTKKQRCVDAVRYVTTATSSMPSTIFCCSFILCL